MPIKGLVSAVVLNWNGKDIIFPCLDSLLSQTYAHCEVILVDNGSTDGSLQLIEGKYGSGIKIIRNSENLGFAEGVNVGIRQSRGEFIALLNSDATVKENWLSELVNAMEGSPKIGMCACKIYLEGRDNILDNTGGLITRDGSNRPRGRLQQDSGQYDSSEDVFCPSGCAALYRRSMLDEVGLFDKHFFAYGEDVDVGLRGRMLGYRAVYVPAAVAYHKFSASFGIVSPAKVFYVERNRLWTVIRCFPLRHIFAAITYTLARYGYHFSGIFSKKGPAAHFSRQFSLARLIWLTLKAYLSTLIFLPYLLLERIRIRKKSVWKAKDFEDCFRRYGISARELALSELH